jgi:cobalamin biosynthesis protein CobT
MNSLSSLPVWYEDPDYSSFCDYSIPSATDSSHETEEESNESSITFNTSSSGTTDEEEVNSSDLSDTERQERRPNGKKKVKEEESGGTEEEEESDGAEKEDSDIADGSDSPTKKLREDDGYRWRSNGGKILRGTGQYRIYYVCSSTEKNKVCPATKIVDRVFKNGPVAAIDYKGKHNHPPLPIEKQRLDCTDC